MSTWTNRLTLGLLLAAVASGPLTAQPSDVPVATDITVVPVTPYEPAPSRNKKPTPITPVGFQDLDEPRPGSGVDLKKSHHNDDHRYWTRLDYLAWWINPSPVSTALVTTNTPPAIGALNEAGTQVLFGRGSDQEKGRFGAFNGARLAVGGWGEGGYEYSWEVNAFYLQRRDFHWGAETLGGASAPIVAIPFYATQPFNLVTKAGETALSSGGAPANVTVNMSSQLWGAEINELANVWTTERFYCLAVLGVRYLDLCENLNYTHTSYDPQRAGAAVAVTDGFGTRSRFFGGQIGARFGCGWDRWNFDVSAVVALGSTHNKVSINGDTTVTGGALGFADGVTPGGVFAQPSNIGHVTRSVLAVAPEVQLKVGYALSSRIQPFLAYNVLYLSGVARPGNQIERNINPTQNAFFVPPGQLVGSPSPVNMSEYVRVGDFWAQGIQIGLSILY